MSEHTSFSLSEQQRDEGIEGDGPLERKDGIEWASRPTRGGEQQVPHRAFSPVRNDRMDVEQSGLLRPWVRGFHADHDCVLHLAIEVADGAGGVRHQDGVALVVGADFFHGVEILGDQDEHHDVFRG